MTKNVTPYPILRIRVGAADNSQFLRATRGELRRGWSRHCDYPAFFAPHAFYAEYLRDRGGRQRNFRLYLLRTDPDTLSAVSIVPSVGALSLPEHRAVLEDFRESVLNLPETRHFPVAVVQPENITASAPPPEVEKVLNHWCGLLNKGAGFHPFDPAGWEYLLVNLHLTKRSISFDWLVDWFSLKHSMTEDALIALEDRFYSSMTFLARHQEGLHFQRETRLKRDRERLN